MGEIANLQNQDWADRDTGCILLSVSCFAHLSIARERLLPLPLICNHWQAPARNRPGNTEQQHRDGLRAEYGGAGWVELHAFQNNRADQNHHNTPTADPINANPELYWVKFGSLRRLFFLF